MTNKQQLFTVALFLSAITYIYMLFYLDGFYYTKDAPDHAWLMLHAFGLLILAGLLKLTIIIQDVINEHRG